MAMINQQILQAIEHKLDELESVEPSDGDGLDRETRRYALMQIVDAVADEREALHHVDRALLGELAQLSMF